MVSRWVLAVMMLIPAAGFGQVRIGGFALSANGSPVQNHRYSGRCPVDLKFDWGVIGARAETVTYHTERSDGAKGPVRTVTLPGGNRSVPVVVDWRLGANTAEFKEYRGWQELVIESPSRVSQRILFTLECR